jgi:polysaccharide biosynthesis protein PslH
MQKALYITNNDPSQKTGGSIISQRNFRLCSFIFDNPFLYYIRDEKRFLKKLKNRLFGYALGNSATTNKDVLSMIQSEGIHFLFIEGSMNGKLIKYIKRKHTKIVIISYFQNDEFKFVLDMLVSSCFTKILSFMVAVINERITSRYTDLFLFITEKDCHSVTKRYGIRNPSYSIIPVTLNDVSIENIETSVNDSSFVLFVGSAFYANVHAMIWYLNNVAPKIKKNTVIIGKGMKRALRKFADKSNVEVLDYVDDVSRYYQDALLVVAPVFLGSGMKIKIAEALMYEKVILGTSAVFEGYNAQESVGMIICEKADEYIERINLFDSCNRYNKHGGEYFREQFSSKNERRYADTIAQKIRHFTL